MGNYDDIIERGYKRPLDAEDKAVPKGEPINIVELLEGPDSPFSSVIENMNPEMKSKVIVPLAGLLDKYGLGESLSASPTASGAVGLMSVIGDIAPVIKGLADFVSGQKNGLAEDDKKFLEEIMKAEESSEFSDLFNDIGDSVEESVPATPAPKIHPLIGELPSVDISKGPVDWMAVMDPDGTYEKNQKNKSMNLEAYAELVPKINPMSLEPRIKMPSLEELAAEAGLNVETLKAEDSNIRPNEEPIIDIVSESFSEDLVDSIMDVESVEDIFYLDDGEYETMLEQGIELEEIPEDD
jgi:hypothetical protein